MPSCDASGLARLAQHLTATAEQGDWTRLQQLDALLQQWLQQTTLQQQFALSTEWQAVRAAHAHALARCQAAKAAAATQLQGLTTQQEAHSAYAWQEVLV